jgi:hypothetical protein
MLLIYNKDNVARVIRPCPLITINYTANKNKSRSLGGYYDITLNGTIIAHEGSPLLITPSGGQGASAGANFAAVYDPRPAGQIVPIGNRLGSILEKQNAIRSLFAVDGHRMELLSIDGNEPLMVFYPTVQSVSFEEGIYVDICRYTVSLRAEFLLDKDDKIISDGLTHLNREPTEPPDLVNGQYPTTGYFGDSGRKLLETHIAEVGGLVEDFSDSWSIEEEANGITVDPYGVRPENTIKTYRLTRNLSATGKTIHGPQGGVNKRWEAWEQAQGFIRKRLSDEYPSIPPSGTNKYFASGFINIAQNAYGGYNHSRSESIDKTNGTYSVSETWLLSSGTAYENYSLSLSSSSDSTTQTVSINGTIKGLSSIPPSGTIFGGNFTDGRNTPYENATIKYNEVTGNGGFGVTSHIYKRVQNVTPVTINPTPKSISVGVNEFTGEITYDIQFDSRPLANVPGTLSELVTINDTYPGDVFASIPVLGRQTGPVLQYLGTRTEYRRDVSIDLVFEPPQTTTTTTTTAAPGTPPQSTTTTTTTLPPNQAIPKYRDEYLYTKPTLWEPARTQINNIIKSVSPAYEFGIRKYFLNPPSESWNPKERRYTLNLTWTYELDH